MDGADRLIQRVVRKVGPMSAKILTIAQQKGGAGKTTLVAQLATAWHTAGQRVAIMDIDQQGSLASWYRLRETNEDAGGLHLSEVAGWRVSTELDKLRDAFDIVIIDTPPHAETDAKIAIRAANLVLIPVQPSAMDVWATRGTLDLAAGEQVPALVILNRVPPRGLVLDAVRGMLAQEKMPVAKATMGNRVIFAATMMTGKGVVEFARRSIAAEEIRAIAKEVGRKLRT